GAVGLLSLAIGERVDVDGVARARRGVAVERDGELAVVLPPAPIARVLAVGDARDLLGLGLALARDLDDDGAGARGLLAEAHLVRRRDELRDVEHRVAEAVEADGVVEEAVRPELARELDVAAAGVGGAALVRLIGGADAFRPRVVGVAARLEAASYRSP